MKEVKEIYIREYKGTTPLALDAELRRLGVAQLRKSPNGREEWQAVYTREAAGYTAVLFPKGRWGYVVDLLTDERQARARVIQLIRAAGWRIVPHKFFVWGDELIDR